MAKQSLLVADADPRSLRILEVALRKAGFSVATAVDGAEALRRIQRSAPDLVLCEAVLPGQDGLSVCRAVRADPRIAGMPFVVMSADKSPALQARAIEAGSDEFLAKPLLIKELVTRLRLRLERREKQRNAQRESPAALTGAVDDLGLVDLFQSLDNWRKSATVTCESEGRDATVWVRDGQVIDADAPPVAAEAAFYRLLNWETGTFRVEFGAVDREERITTGTAGLLMEAMRRVDELGRAVETLPLGTRLAVDFDVLAQKLGELPDEVNGILKLFDGRRALREALDRSPLDDLSTLAVVQRLMADGVLGEGKPRAPAQKPSLQQWLGAGAPASAAPPARSGFVFSPHDEREAPAATDATGGLEAALAQPSGPEAAAGPPQAADVADAAAGLAQAMALAETVEAEKHREEEDRAALALAERPLSLEAPPLPLVRFPPLRGARRERLRREADEARAQIAGGQVLRLSRLVELPAVRPGGADVLSSGVRRMSPAVGEAAKKFAPDLPVAALQGLAAPAARRLPLSELDTDPGFRAPPAELDLAAVPGDLPSAAETVAAETVAAETVAAATVIAERVVAEPVAAGPVVAEPVFAAAAAPVPAVSPAPDPGALKPGEPEPGEPEPPVEATAALEPSPAHEASAPPVSAHEAAGPEARAHEAAAPEPMPAHESEVLGPVLTEEAAAALAAGEASGPVPESAPFAQAVPPSTEAFAASAPVRIRPLPAARSEADDFEADLRAALGGGRRRRWPWVAGVLAAAVALVFLLRPQPATDKKDSPWLDGAQPVAKAEPAKQAPATAGTKAFAAAPDPKPGALESKAAGLKPAGPEPKAVAAALEPKAAAPTAAQPSKPDSGPTIAAAGLVPTPETDDYARALDDGEKLLKRGRYRQAVTEFKRAVQHNPESVPALLALGDAWLEADAPRSALKPLQKAATLDLRSGRAQLLLGTAWQSLGKNADAIRAYQRYLELEPSGEFARDVRSILANLAP